MLSILNIVHLKDNVSAGAGKLSTITEDSGDSYVAVVHQNTIAVMKLNKEGSDITKQWEVNLEGLFEDRISEMQVLWCPSSEPVLIVSQSCQLIKVKNDSDDEWRAILVERLEGHDGRGLSTALLGDENSMYIGTTQGVWELGTDFQSQSRLTRTATTAMAKYSRQWLAIGDGIGAITLLQYEQKQWSQKSQVRTKNKSSCFTSLLIEENNKVLIGASSTGIISVYSLPALDLLMERPAHIRWISQLWPCRGGFISAAEDSFLHFWTLESGANHIEYADSLQLEDCLITGGAAVGRDVQVVTVYDRPRLFFVTVGGQDRAEIGESTETNAIERRDK